MGGGGSGGEGGGGAGISGAQAMLYVKADDHTLALESHTCQVVAQSGQAQKAPPLPIIWEFAANVGDEVLEKSHRHSCRESTAQ